ncbi:MAG: asparaginase domain-containing protein [Sediminibacterium sp.]|nr:asparaginase domain-containing protein [Sediminibacterium sp.]
MNLNIQFFITGGTFDKEYNELNGSLFFKDSHLVEMLRLGRCLAPYQIRTLMMVDSLNMTDFDRKIILDNCISCSSKNIIITHGTDTMVETALVLGESIKDKVVILTGAMIPYKFGSSDGLFNLGSALAYCKTLSNGVYIVMNGNYFFYNSVKKNKDLGIFEKIS